ncbi:zinc finger protein-like 1 [Panonychus citri]|uniref:zinc finger protein-like 1 n=1 Tax=Panonychus citri TaxID=50023 RepID=UPI00230814EB|nr:zinc finger protein-like 1 [Panonychus citri]
MGLCKCPKRKVTLQFCFEHKVNVCESCMLSNHSKCIVRPYLQWLEDSTYEPVCGLCHQNLNNDNDCVRLICYHIFHWNCLNNYANSLPSNTAPGGYSCPDCTKTIFPPTELNSPIANHLRKLLSTVKWSRAGLGLPLIETNSPKTPNSSHNKPQPKTYETYEKTNLNENVQLVSAASANSLKSQPTHVPVNVNHISDYVNCDEVNFVTNARKFHHVSSINPNNANTFLDIDDDKYRRKTPLELITKWFRIHNITKQNDGLSLKGWIVIGFVAIFTVFTLVHYFLKLGRQNADHDPLLDPHFNPNIHVGQDDD